MDFIDLTGSDVEDDAANLLSRFNARPRPRAASRARSGLSVQGIPTPTPSSEPMLMELDPDPLHFDRTMPPLLLGKNVEETIHAPRPHNPALRSLVAAIPSKTDNILPPKLRQTTTEAHELLQRYIDLSSPTPSLQSSAAHAQALHTAATINSRVSTNRPSDTSRVLGMMQRVITRAGDLKDQRSASSSPSVTSPQNMPPNTALPQYRYEPHITPLVSGSALKRTYDGAIKAPPHSIERGGNFPPSRSESYPNFVTPLRQAEHATHVEKIDHHAKKNSLVVPRDRAAPQPQVYRPFRPVPISIPRLDLSNGSSLISLQACKTPHTPSSQLLLQPSQSVQQPLLLLPQSPQLLPQSSHLATVSQPLLQPSQTSPALQIPPISQAPPKSQSSQLASPPELRKSFAHLTRNSGSTSPFLLIEDEEVRTKASLLFDQINKDPPTSGRFTAAEDQLIILLRTQTHLSWLQTGDFFPFRNNWHCMQARYSTSLTHRQDLKNSVPTPITTRLQGSEPKNPISRPRGTSPQGEPEHEDSGSDCVSRSFRRRKQINYNVKQNFQTILDSIDAEVLPNESSYLDSLPGNSNLPRTIANLPINPQIQYQARITRERQLAALAGGTKSIVRRPVNAKAAQRPPLTDRRKTYKTAVLRPYLQRHEVESSLAIPAVPISSPLGQTWHDTVYHVDFSPYERQQLKSIVLECLPYSVNTNLETIVKQFDATFIQQISQRAILNRTLPNRSVDSIQSYLQDLRQDAKQPNTARICRTRIRRSTTLPNSLTSRLRNRELGLWPQSSIMMRHTFGPLLTFTGTSGDVNNVAWHPDGVLFAVGSAALTDTNSMQYNEANNLLLGDTSYKTLRELPDHAIERPPSSVNPNSATSMQEPFLFTTISNVQFSTTGDFMFSAGYDNLVRVWQIPKQESAKKTRCVMSFKLKEKVDVLSVNCNGIWAAGCSTALDSVHVLRYGDDMLYNKDPTAFKKCSFSSVRAKSEYDSGTSSISLSPSCLKWGQPIYGQEKFLLCGFSAPRQDMPPAGEVCMWDVEAEQRTFVTSSRNVFDIAWCPTTYGRFAVGCNSTQSSRNIKSAVRIYDSLRTDKGIKVATHHKIELDCPASDMNDVVFSPHDYNIVSAGCTDGTVYVWDLRNPDNLLHRFVHGAPLVQLYDNEFESRENQDTGVRFLSWNNRSLFSGSSDGTVQAWNPYVAPEDAHIRQIAQLKSGVMAGQFSPEYSSLLLGEVNGSVSVFSVCHEDEEPEKFALQEAIKEKNRLRKKYGVVNNSRPGVTQSRKLLVDKEIKIRPLGGFPRGQAVQGKHYTGPLDCGVDAPYLREEAAEFQSRMRQSASPCHFDHEMMLTEEDRGDSGASQQRIPWALRHSGDVELQECLNAVCDGRLVVAEDFADIVECTDCDRSWRVDVLGYTPLEPQIVSPARALNPCRNMGRAASAQDAGSGDEKANVRIGRARRQTQRFGRTGERYHTFWGQQEVGGEHEAECDFGMLSDRMGALRFDEIPEELQHETYVLMTP